MRSEKKYCLPGCFGIGVTDEDCIVSCPFWQDCEEAALEEEGDEEVEE